MTSAAFGMDNYMPDWTEDFDFGAWVNLPPDDVDQGGEDGYVVHTSGQWGSVGSDHASELVPEMCDERRIKVPRPSHISTLPGSSDETKTYPRTGNASPVTGYGTSHLYGDESEASGYLQPVYATTLKTTDSERFAMGEYGEGRPVSSIRRPLTPVLADHGIPGNFSACVSCLCSHSDRYDQSSRGYKCRFLGCEYFEPYCPRNFINLINHWRSHYGQPGKYTCLEQNCHVVTKNFGDLKRHYTKHCTKPDKEKFPCPVLWCKYSGNNGFARKDKLKSHYKNIHEGKSGPVKGGRVIKPATLKPQVSGFGGCAGKQKE